MITTVGLDLGTIPHPGEKWRIVVRDKGFSPNGAALGKRWYDGTGSAFIGTAFADNGLSTLGKGFPVSMPVSSGAYFCMDVKFPVSGVTIPLSRLAIDWTDRLGGEVVRVKKVSASESSSAGATDRAAQLRAAIEDAPKGISETVREAGKTAVDTLQLLFWTVIIGGTVYLLTKGQTFRKK